MNPRVALLAAALAAFAPAPMALAADLGEYVPVEPCAHFVNQRGYDDVYQPPQTAYIVASSCDPMGIDMVTLFSLGKREKILVYYNGGSMHKTDIDLLVVPR
jgi:hypothetical protein